MKKEHLHRPIPIGALVSDPTTGRYAMITDYMAGAEWGRIDMDSANMAGIIYGIHFMDGKGPYKTYRYGYEIKVLSGKA